MFSAVLVKYAFFWNLKRGTGNVAHSSKIYIIYGLFLTKVSLKESFKSFSMSCFVTGHFVYRVMDCI